MNVLSIGNSFSQDATRYLHRIARERGEKLTTVNLYIGGCSLERHFRNLHSGERAYSLEINGHSSGFYVSLREALLNRAWDVVTLQQASVHSFDFDSYQPYLEVLAGEVRRLCPKTRLWIHQTWAYEDESKPLTERTDFPCGEAMFAEVKAAYAKAAEAVGACGILPVGELIGRLCKRGIGPMYRDGFHLSRGLGRYAAALLWYGMLTGASVKECAFVPWEEETDPRDMAAIRAEVAALLEEENGK